MTRIPVRTNETKAQPESTRTISCGDCVMAGTDACDDCVVTFIVNREPGDAVVVDATEERALRALGDEGLVPRLRHHSRRTG